MQPQHLATASLLFQCADKMGTIALLTNFFAERKVNISRYEDITEDGCFFARVEWLLHDGWLKEQDFISEFQTLANNVGATFTVRFFNRKQTIGLLVSSKTHIMTELLNISEPNAQADIEVSFIIGNDESLSQLAGRYAVPFFYISTDDAQTDALSYERQQLEIVNRYKPDCLGLAGYREVLSANFIKNVACPLIGIDRSLLAYTGSNPNQVALERGVKLLGATASFMTAAVQQGPIIEQRVQRVGSGAYLQDVQQIGNGVEQEVFKYSVLKVLQHKVIVYKNRTIIFN